VLAAALATSAAACWSMTPDHAEQRFAAPKPLLTLVPVPSSRAASRRRGEDVMLDLAAGAARRLSRAEAFMPASVAARGARARGRRADVPGPGSCRVLAALEQVRGVRDQAGLNARDRVENTRGRFRLRRSARLPPTSAGRRPALPRAVVVVDDVLTTGSSAAAAVQALVQGGYPVLAVATIAWTPLRRAWTSGTDSPTFRTVEPPPPGLAWMPRPEERGEGPRR
jgi:predicted amidophosphoribosyltransferase